MTEESKDNKEVLIDLSTSDELCGICGDPLYTKYSISLPCNHNYHYECINDSCLLSKKMGCQTCPYCGYNFKVLKPVNGLKKLKYGVHWYSESDTSHYTNVKCNHIMKRGKRVGEECGKYCQLGYTKCTVHNIELKEIIKNKSKSA